MSISAFSDACHLLQHYLSFTNTTPTFLKNNIGDPTELWLRVASRYIVICRVHTYMVQLSPQLPHHTPVGLQMRHPSLYATQCFRSRTASSFSKAFQDIIFSTIKRQKSFLKDIPHGIHVVVTSLLRGY